MREVSETVVLEGKTVPKGTVIQVPVYGLHHSPELWHDPEVFWPERFDLEESLKRHSMTFQPFGIGPRNCIGQRFARAFTKLAWARILQKFRLELPEPGIKVVHIHKNFQFQN
ncbi:CYP3A4 [Cordylochernes scorpioides]|uniref:CYP3A4 n=1 Tax=Cordylochernes scorpioides TaxID=51811 RepID=A0ABY6K289_9ARAC|nr:CYP3A4 [Cordylochernes scorpioides]